MIEFKIENLSQTQRDLFDLLGSLVSEGSALMYYEACSLLLQPGQFITASHLIGHLYREVGGTILDVWSPKMKGDEIQRRRIQFVIDSIGLSGRDDLISVWLESELPKEAHRLGLRYPRIVDQSTIKKYQGLDAIWITILRTLSKSNFLKEKYLKIEEFQAMEDPTNDAVSYIDTSFPYSQIFFRELFEPTKKLSAKWFVLLRQKDFFKYPHEPMRLQNGNIYYPSWHQIQYLISVTEVYPDDVYEIMFAVAETKNEYIQVGICDIALKLNPAKSDTLAKKVIECYIKNTTIGYSLADKLTRWIQYLFKNQYNNTAMQIAHELLLFPSAETIEDHYYRSEAVPKLELWAYDAIVDKLRKGINGIFTIELFSDILESALIQETPLEKYGDVDYTYLWRTSIERSNAESPIRSIDKVIDVLVEEIELFLSDSPESLHTVLAILSKYNKSTFIRIQLYLLNRGKLLSKEQVNQYILNEKVIRNECVQTEYFKLLGKGMTLLSEDDKEFVLSTNMIGQLDGMNSKSEAANDSWKLKRLHYIKDHLPEKWQKTYHDLIQIYGEPQESDFGSIYTMRSGYVSPIPIDELKSLSLAEIVSRVNSLPVIVSGNRWSETEELSRALTLTVSANTSKYLEDIACVLTIENAAYLRGIMSGFEAALEKGILFPIEGILPLCKHISSLDYNLENTERSYDAEIEGAKKGVIWFLSKLRSKNMIVASSQITSEILQILLSLSNDKDPVDGKYAFVDGDYEYGHLGLNCVRSSALKAALEYTAWIKHNDLANSAKPVEKVLEKLKEHLNPITDQSPIVRQIYGSCLGTLCFLSQEWVDSNIDSIFPMEKENKALLQQAWRDYLSFNRANYLLFPKIRKYYLLSLHDKGMITTKHHNPHPPILGLAEHLIQYYIWGLIELSDPLLNEFYENSDPETIAHAMKFARPMKIDETNGEDNVYLNRAKSFWEYRLSKARKGISETEISMFGWWFADGQLNTKWGIEQLINALQFSKTITGSYQILKQLGSMESHYAEQSLDSLELMFKGDRQIVAFQEEEVRVIIQNAFVHSSGVRDKAMAFVINLVAKEGYRQYSDILKN